MSKQQVRLLPDAEVGSAVRLVGLSPEAEARARPTDVSSHRNADYSHCRADVRDASARGRSAMALTQLSERCVSFGATCAESSGPFCRRKAAYRVQRQ